MRKHFVLMILFVIVGAIGIAQTPPQPLKIYFIDVEGGQATLFVSPAGQSMLVDAGWPGFDGRDADRIRAAAAQAGVMRIDYLVVTHYHRDHVGGVPALAARIPIGTFVDHGRTVEEGDQAAALYRDYVAVRDQARHLQVKPGDTIPIAGVDVRIVSAAGDLIAAPVPGAGQPNPLCREFKPREEDKTENARSVGMLLTFGRFHMVDLGDLTWNKEHELVCPNNRLGAVDLYLTTHHGLDQSGAPVLVHAIRPKAAVMNNGATKGGSPEAWSTVRAAPGLQDIWQLHYAVNGGADHNAPEPFIANMDEKTAHGITVTAQRDGSFTVTNTRNGNTKSYR